MDFRTRMIRLRNKIAAHSITDSRTIYDPFYYYKLGSGLLENKFIQLIGSVGHKDLEHMYVGKPKFYYKSSHCVKGMDDDIVNGYIVLSASGPLFPEITFKMYIQDRKLEMPDKFSSINKTHSFDTNGFKKWLVDSNTRYSLGEGSKSVGRKIPTVYFGDQSKERTDLLQPVETGDQIMWGRSTGPYVGV